MRDSNLIQLIRHIRPASVADASIILASVLTEAQQNAIIRDIERICLVPYDPKVPHPR